MRVIYIVGILTFVALGGLLGAYCGRIKKKQALGIALTALGFAGFAFLMAVLPGNSFYGQVFYAGNTEEKVVALTFDDGPYPPYTNQILQILQTKKVPATFFLVGENVKAFPAVACELAAAGHALGTHTYHHVDLLRLSQSEVAAELTAGKKAIEDTTKVPVTLMRPPHGFKDANVLEVARQLGLEVVNWSVIPRDWTNPGVETIVQRVLENVQPGAIVLLHDGDSPAKKSSRAQTVAALPLIIDGLRAQGYRFVTVQQLQKIGGQQK